MHHGTKQFALIRLVCLPVAYVLFVCLYCKDPLSSIFLANTTDPPRKQELTHYSTNIEIGIMHDQSMNHVSQKKGIPRCYANMLHSYEVYCNATTIRSKYNFTTAVDKFSWTPFNMQSIFNIRLLREWLNTILIVIKYP